METILYPTETKAKKEHLCDFCFGKIKQGEQYMKSTHTYDGYIYDWKAHTYCSKIAERLKMYDDCDEGLTADIFQENIHHVHDDLLIDQIPEADIHKFSDIIQQLRRVRFFDKLMYVIRHYAKLDKANLETPPH